MIIRNHTIKISVCPRDDKYTLKGCIELDEGFVSMKIPKEKNDEKLKTSAGSQRKSKVMVIVDDCNY